LSNDWFSTLYFKPQNGLLPELIDKDGNRTAFAKICKNKFLMQVLRETFLKDEPRPYIIYNGTHDIHHLNKLFVSDRHKKIIQTQEVAFYFFEPLTHYTSPLSIDRHLSSHILRINNESYEVEKIRSFELDSISQWVEENKIKNLKVYCTDYQCHTYYQKHYPNIKLLSLDLFVSWWSKRRHRSIIKENLQSKKIKKKFWSGAWRYDASRHFITAYLANQDLTLNNNVSFFFKVSNAEFKRRMWFGWHEFELRHNELSKKLIDGNTKLQNQVPLSIEIRDTTALGEYATDPEVDGGGKNIRKSQNPVDSYQESFCAIIQESRVTQPWPNISEKTMNAIENHRPFVMVGAPGTLKMLKDMGFKTFDSWWDESYDDINNNVDRLAKICKVIDYIDSFSLDELRSMYNDMMSILIHNEENLHKIPKFYNKLNKRLNKNFKK
jgi:hypothetical protein